MRLPCAEFTIDHRNILEIEVSISRGSVASASEASSEVVRAMVRCKIMKSAYLTVLASDFPLELSQRTKLKLIVQILLQQKIYSTTETQEINTVKVIVQQQQKKRVHRTL